MPGKLLPDSFSSYVPGLFLTQSGHTRMSPSESNTLIRKYRRHTSRPDKGNARYSQAPLPIRPPPEHTLISPKSCFGTDFLSFPIVLLRIKFTIFFSLQLIITDCKRYFNHCKFSFLLLPTRAESIYTIYFVS